MSEPIPQPITESLRRMHKLLSNLLARADSLPFRTPVDWKSLELFDYPKIIKHPMDLGTIKKKLDKNKYNDASEVAEDVRLVWKNCMTYNADGSDFYNLAESFSKRFEERFLKIMEEFGEDVVCGNVAGGGTGKKRSNSSGNSRASTPTPGGFERKDSIASSQLKDAGKKKKSNTEGIVPLDVRTRFAARLQRLSGMELGHVLKVIDMQCPSALQEPPPDTLRSDYIKPPPKHNYCWDEFDGGCQIEIDIDVIPPTTFYELDTYVKEKVKGRGRGAWSDDLEENTMGSDFGGVKQGKKRKSN